MSFREHILVVDDEPSIRFGIRNYLEAAGYRVSEAETVSQATEACGRIQPHAAIVDYGLPDGNGVDLIGELVRLAPTAPVIMLTAHGSIDLAVSAVKQGATTLVTKPVELPRLLALLKQSLGRSAAAGPANTLVAAAAERSRERSGPRGAGAPEDPFLGTSAAIQKLREEVRRLRGLKSPVLILGETGVGKGVLARWIHARAGASAGPFVDLNCAGLSNNLIDNELFGHARGAFTGAVSDRPGLLERADGGSLFLDEIGDMPLEVQGKLLKVLEEKRFRRLGELNDRVVDVRLIAATHCPLGRLVKEQRFRADLYYRIATFPLAVPPLRQRVEDIPVLAQALADRAAGAGPSATFTTSALDALAAYSWPGNIRELRNVVERALVSREEHSTTISAEHLRLDPFPAEESAPQSSATLRELEHTRIEEVLRSVGGKVEEAGKILGIPRSSLYWKIRKYGIVVPKTSG